MLLEKQANQVPPPPNSLSVTSYWVQEGSLGVGRQAIIHLGDCPLCDDGRKAGAQDRWYGPFASLISAREISDQLSDVAMRAECKCIRKNSAQDLPTLALLNEPLFRKPNPKPAPKAAKEPEKTKEQEPRKSARTLAAEAKARKAKRAKTIRYSAISVAAIVAIAIWLFVLPATSVVEASGQIANSPFLLTNSSPIPLNDVQAECSVDLQPSAVHLQNSQAQLADSLGSKAQVAIPCFQSAGGAVPQLRGTVLHMTVKYSVFGIRHLGQDFAFVAARTPDGFAKWVLKGQS